MRGPWPVPFERHRFTIRCAPCTGGAGRPTGIYVKPGISRCNGLVWERKVAMVKLLAFAVAFLCSDAGAADRIKVGFLSTLSGPSAALGVDIRDGFNLALKHLDGRLEIGRAHV